MGEPIALPRVHRPVPLPTCECVTIQPPCLPTHPARPALPCPALPTLPAFPACSWVNLFNRDALVKFVPTVLSCLAMIFTLEHFAHPLALPAGKLAGRAAVVAALRCVELPSCSTTGPHVGQLPTGLPTPPAGPVLPLTPAPAACLPAVLAAINVAFHLGRLVLGVTLEQAMDANWVIRPTVSDVIAELQSGRKRASGISHLATAALALHPHVCVGIRCILSEPGCFLLACCLLHHVCRRAPKSFGSCGTSSTSQTGASGAGGCVCCCNLLGLTLL